MEAMELETQLSVEDAIRQRRSVRGFLPRPVPEEILKKVFELAQRAPSNCNIQPWRVYVASGKARDRVREALLDNIRKGAPPNPDYTYPGKFDDPYRRYQVDCAVALYSEMGIGREDKAGRFRATLRNFEFFDAPHVGFIGMDKSFGETVALDVGIYLQTLMLAMTAHGISSCAQGSMRSYPDVVRKEFGVSENIRILVGISFGYEDPGVAANRTRVGRAPFDENVILKWE
ncbi:nitroreductase [Candidatus Sumerlaeota bacterium]|nr:nitroreductase [Candidatus Sumerlaeota bacterium]